MRKHLFPLNLSAPPGFKFFREPTSFLFKKVENDIFGDNTIHLEDDDNNIVDFIGDTLTFAVVFIKLWAFAIYPKWQVMKYSESTFFK